MTPRQEAWRGMNWIRQDKRLAIYIRDGLSCCYCGSSVEDGVQLSLDHLDPHKNGGTNHERNLVTCCKSCNSSRGDRPVEDFAEAVAQYRDHGITASRIISHIADCVSRPLHRDEARQLIALRGSAARAVTQF